MPVDSTHLLYDEFLEKWSRARDVIEGEDRVKASGERYLPRLDSQDDEEYGAYVQRSSFFNATGRTAEGFQGMVFRRDPVIKLPEGGAPAGDVISRFNEDCDLFGTSLYLYAKKVAGEILGVGRAGTLVEWHDVEERPFLCLYQAEQIINWRVERMSGRNVLTLMVLRETSDNFEGEDYFEAEAVPQIRVLRLVRNSEGAKERKGGGEAPGMDRPSMRLRSGTRLIRTRKANGNGSWSRHASRSAWENRSRSFRSFFMGRRLTSQTRRSRRLMMLSR